MTADVSPTSTFTDPSDTDTAPSAGSSSTLYFGSSPGPWKSEAELRPTNCVIYFNVSVCNISLEGCSEVRYS